MILVGGTNRDLRQVAQSVGDPEVRGGYYHVFLWRTKKTLVTKGFFTGG